MPHILIQVARLLKVHIEGKAEYLVRNVIPKTSKAWNAIRI